MFINKLNISYLLGFTVGKIASVDMTFNEPTTIILGDNGAGKSTLLRNIFPININKNSFVKEEDLGSHYLVVEHRGNEYRLSTTKEGSSKLIYSFIENNKELNINGNVSTQLELMDSKLGINTDILKLITANYRLSEMTIGARKELLIKTHLSNLAYAHELYKKIQSRVRDRRANIKLLTSEVLELDKKMIDNEVWERVRATYKENIELKEYCLLLVNTIDNQIETLKKSRVECTISTIPNSVNCVVSEFEKVNRRTYQDDRLSYNATLRSISNTLSNNNEILVECVHEVEKYDSYLKNNDTTDIEDLLKYKKGMEEELKSYTDRIGDATIYTQETIQGAEHTFCMIKDDLTKLGDLERYPRVRYKRLERIVGQCSSKMTDINNRIASLHKAFEELNELTINKYQVSKDCNKSNCDLYVQFSNKKQTVLEKQMTIKKEIETYKKLLSRYTNWYTKLYPRLEEYTPANTIYVGMDRYLHNQLLRDIITSSTLIYTNPLALIKKIQDAIDIYYLNTKKIQIENEYRVLVSRIEEWNKQGISSTKYLTELKEKVLKKIDTLKNKQKELLVEQTKLTKEIEVIERYIEIRDSICSLEEQIDKYIYNKEVDANIEFFMRVRDAIIKTLRDTEVSLQETKVITDIQTQIRDRKEHIGSMLDKLNTSLEDEVLLETALSPTLGIPNLYMKSHVNTLIKNTNVLISKVWSYPLQLVAVKDKVDYTFPIQVDGVLVNDISTCSDSQKAIVDLCFTIALMIQMRMTDYPLLLDEIDRPMDDLHKQELINLFTYITENGLINQMFLVNHSTIISGMPGNYVVLKGDNITLPSVYNVTTKIEYL